MLKKFILVSLLFLSSSVFAVNLNYVSHVNSVKTDDNETFAWVDWEQFGNKYNIESEILPVYYPPLECISSNYCPPSRYILPLNVYVAHSEKEHVANYFKKQQYLIRIYVRVQKNTTERIFVWEINENEQKAGANERLIDDDLTGSKYKINTLDYGNVKYYVYDIPDLSNATKRIRVTTCKKWKGPAEKGSECGHVITYIKGTAN